MQTKGKLRVPRAVIPTLEEMALPLEERLLSLWQRNTGVVQQQFKSLEAYMRQCGDGKAQVELEGTQPVPKTSQSAGLQSTESVAGV